MTEWSGEEYAQISALQKSMAHEALSALAFAGDEAVVDIGCGDGFITAALAQMVSAGVVVGVDPSRGMITAAARRGRVSNSGPWFVRGDARHLPFRETFDAAVSFNALHWVPEQQRALDQIASAMRPGARALIQLVCASERPSVEAVAMSLCRNPRWARRFDGFAAPFFHPQPSEYDDLAARAGLTVASLTVTDREWDFGGRDGFAYWCSVGSAAWTDRLEGEDRHGFVDQLVDSYEAVSGRPGLFRFMQMRVQLIKTPAKNGSPPLATPSHRG
jgi:trans-aconitate 2-methyltransferase